VAIDAPCSGVRMLWSAILTAFALAAVLRLPASRTVALAAAASATVVLANGVRAAALFLPETGAVLLPPWTHAAIGVVTFAGAGFLVLRAALSLAPAADAS
jgi:exosortase/archaeosortase family protein